MTGGDPFHYENLNISIHMPHTWHDSAKRAPVQQRTISIHMPHTWHDLCLDDAHEKAVRISIHMPHTWHDGRQHLTPHDEKDFNPHATYVA